MNRDRKTALIAGIFFIVAFVASVPPAFVLYDAVLHDPHFIVGSSGDVGVAAGALFEVIVAISVIGTAVTLLPVVKGHGEGIALGYVAGRVVEAILILMGIISLLSIVTLRQAFAQGALTNVDSLVSTSRSLVAIHDWTFLLGPNLALGPNTLMLAFLMYRSRLVPRFIAILGLVGGPLIFAFAAAVMFGVFQQVSLWGAIGALPVFAWEMSLAVYLIVKGFRPSGLKYPVVVGENAKPA
jgi:hypothetical protein